MFHGIKRSSGWYEIAVAVDYGTRESCFFGISEK
jgi:hypothetical protein